MSKENIPLGGIDVHMLHGGADRVVIGFDADVRQLRTNGAGPEERQKMKMNGAEFIEG